MGGAFLRLPFISAHQGGGGLKNKGGEAPSCPYMIISTLTDLLE